MRGDQVAFDEMCQTVCDMHGMWNTRYLQLLVTKDSSVKPINFGCDTVSQFKGRWRVSSGLLMTMSRPVTG